MLKTKILTLFGYFLIAFLFASCATGLKFEYTASDNAELLKETPFPAIPPVSFMVMSDLHFYDPSLGTSGPDFEEYLENDRKLLVQSEELLSSVTDIIKGSNADFVLIPGDLTKDGEKICHLDVAAYLSQIEAAGHKVYVVPGNHDILNNYAASFTENGHEKIENITPSEFADIYRPFGYGEALFHDPSSLSYVAEPVPGLWLLALDSCDYSKNPELEEPKTDGRFTQETIFWIEEVLQKSRQQNKGVIAFMHHGVMEHFPSQEDQYGQYIVDNAPQIAELLAINNVRIVFTGHFHAQDITVKEYPDKKKFLFDIETGSLVTFPCPVRYVTIDPDQKMRINSHVIDSLPSLSSKGTDFPSYAEEYVNNGIQGIAIKVMRGLFVKEKVALKLAPQVANAFIAHYRGDESFPGGVMLTDKHVGLMGKLVVSNRRPLVEGLWQDFPPADNNITIDLNNGSWQEN